MSPRGNGASPPAGTPENEALRKQFYRFRETLAELIPIPGNAFETEGDDWMPNFEVQIHKDLRNMKLRISEAPDPDELPDWHPLSRGNSSRE